MRKIISFAHMSLDGYVAGVNGELDWAKVDDQIFHYIGERIKECDTTLYGRKTFALMESYWPTAGKKPNASRHDVEHAEWYKHVDKVVLSKTIKDQQPKVNIISDNLAQKINEIKQQPGSDILLFGSPSAVHSLTSLNLIDGYWLFVNPVILGNGVPLFAGINDKIELQLLPTTRRFSNGVTEINYSVNRP